jgi:hypothetical protein
MPRSAPDNEVMEKQQARDRKPAAKAAKPRPKRKADARRQSEAVPKSGIKAKAVSKPPKKSSAQGGRKRPSAAKSKAAPAPAVASGEPLPPAPDAKRIEDDVRANRGLGGLFRRFRLGWGERKLKRAADAASGRKK